jgi:hypothetical protein
MYINSGIGWMLCVVPYTLQCILYVIPAQYPSGLFIAFVVTVVI